MSDYDEPISDETKVEIAAEFMKYAPPGEFNEVYNDVAKLIDNPDLLKRATSIVSFRRNYLKFFKKLFFQRQWASTMSSSSRPSSWTGTSVC